MSVRPLGETEAAWVTEYFGEEYLHLYQFPAERTDPERTFLVTELTKRIPTGGRVLDLACGQGRHAVALAAAGFHVVGLDYQEHLLREAARAASDQHVALSLVRGDMRCIPFDGVFDAVVNIFTAFGYFSDADNARVLAEVARALKPGGWFILDVANRDALLRQAQPRSWKRLPDGTLVISEWVWDVPTGRYTHTQTLIAGEQQRTLQHSVRVYTCTELFSMLRGVGFAVDGYYGSFRCDPLTLEAPRVICLAKKV